VGPDPLRQQLPDRIGCRKTNAPLAAPPPLTGNKPRHVAAYKSPGGGRALQGHNKSPTPTTALPANPRIPTNAAQKKWAYPAHTHTPHKQTTRYPPLPIHTLPIRAHTHTHTHHHRHPLIPPHTLTNAHLHPHYRRTHHHNPYPLTPTIPTPTNTHTSHPHPHLTPHTQRPPQATHPRHPSHPSHPSHPRHAQAVPFPARVPTLQPCLRQAPGPEGTKAAQWPPSPQATCPRARAERTRPP
jgi:hypothetical protein